MFHGIGLTRSYRESQHCFEVDSANAAPRGNDFKHEITEAFYSDLDSPFHRFINSAAQNRFINRLYDIITLNFSLPIPVEQA